MFGSKEKSRRKLAGQVRDALGAPDWLESVDVDESGRAILVLLADPADQAGAEARRIEAEGRAELVPGVRSVTSILTAQVTATAHKHVKLEPAPRRVSKGARLSDEAMQQGAPTQAGGIPKIAGIDRILVVASAKGGVGKSTVAVNLAAAMARAGMKVGLLDADVYGPSIPTMLGMQDAQPDTAASKKLVPVEAYGMKTLSIGYLSDPDAPMIWRGPIVMSAIAQMLNDAEWGDLDVLVIDTPPGTGDAQLAAARPWPRSWACHCWGRFRCCRPFAKAAMQASRQCCPAVSRSVFSTNLPAQSRLALIRWKRSLPPKSSSRTRRRFRR